MDNKVLTFPACELKPSSVYNLGAIAMYVGFEDASTTNAFTVKTSEPVFEVIIGEGNFSNPTN